MTLSPPPHLDRSRLEQAADTLRQRWPCIQVQWGAILGSGQADLTFPGSECMAEFATSEVPGLGMPTVEGHSGRLRLLRWEGEHWLVFFGRRHWYEGEGWLPVLLPVFLCHALGAGRLILLNAAGGIRPDLVPGDLVLISDHLNLFGDHPFRGPHQPLWGPRFPDLSEVYSPALRKRAHQAAARAGITLKEGIYAGVSGPTYETPAEVQALARLGADVVGMSTVPEAIAARSLGMEVMALSIVANRAAGLVPHPLRHEEITEAVKRVKVHLQQWLAAFAALSAPSNKQSE